MELVIKTPEIFEIIERIKRDIAHENYKCLVKRVFLWSNWRSALK